MSDSDRFIKEIALENTQISRTINAMVEDKIDQAMKLAMDDGLRAAAATARALAAKIAAAGGVPIDGPTALKLLIEILDASWISRC